MQSRHFLAKKSAKKLCLAGNEVLVCPLEERPPISDSTCPVCLDSCSETAHIDSCKHVFCFPCISAWGKITPRCPLCKLKFTSVICPATSSSVERVFVPVSPVKLPDNESDGELSDVEDDEEASDLDYGYEMDGFVVAEDSFDYDDFDEETEEDRVLARADEVLLSRKRRRVTEPEPMIRPSSASSRSSSLHQYQYHPEPAETSSTESSTVETGMVETSSAADRRGTGDISATQSKTSTVSFDSFLASYQHRFPGFT